MHAWFRSDASDLVMLDVDMPDLSGTRGVHHPAGRGRADAPDRDGDGHGRRFLGRDVDYRVPRAGPLAAPAETLTGRTIAELLPPAEAQVCMAALRSGFESGYCNGAQIELQGEAGRARFELSVSRTSVGAGENPRFIVLSRNITERKAAEARAARLACYDSLTGLPNRQSGDLDGASPQLELARLGGHGWQPPPTRSASSSACEIAPRGLECVHFATHLHTMRTNIVIDDKLMKDTLRATGLKTKREAVELGLRTLLRLRQQDEIRKFRGRLDWQGDLDAMRTDK